MYGSPTQFQPWKHLILIVIGVQALQGCQGLPNRSAPSRLDPRTGATVSIAEDVLVFARTEARYARSARDYLYLGPVEVNRQGLREYFLWVGVATTLDRGYLAPETGVPATLQLMLRGEPMEFSLRPWDEIVPRFSAAPSYETNVERYRELGARVTRDQLRLLQEEQAESLRVIQNDGATRLYQAWKNEARWSEFLALGN